MLKTHQYPREAWDFMGQVHSRPREAGAAHSAASYANLWRAEVSNWSQTVQTAEKVTQNYHS